MVHLFANYKLLRAIATNREFGGCDYRGGAL